MSAISNTEPKPVAPAGPPRPPRQDDARRSRIRRDQTASLAIGLAMLVAVFAIQPFIAARRASLVAENTNTLRQLSIEFPRLTLTGLRGIITPMLWAHAEDQKNKRQWVALNTTYNMIAKLEPYFVTVYVFNAWNQAYNLSAQWHAIDDKFKWVLDGLQHLYEGEQLNPGAPDLALEEAQMFYLKIGNSFERITYRQMWRDHIAEQYKFHKISKTADYDTHLQVRNIIMRPEFKTELLEDPEHPNTTGFGVRIRGIQNLDGRQPRQAEQATEFRYGLSPFYFAFAEYDRLIKSGGRPSTLPLKTADAFRAMALRMWCRDDTYHLGELLRRLYLPTEPLSQDKIEATVLEAQDLARNVPLVEPQAENLFVQNYTQWKSNEKVNTKHIREMRCLVPINAGEFQTMLGLLAYKQAQDKVTPQSQQHLLAAIAEYNKALALMDTYINLTWPNVNHPDRADPEALVAGVRTRIAGINALLHLEPGRRADMSFLRPNVVEK